MLVVSIKICKTLNPNLNTEEGMVEGKEIKEISGQ